MYSVAINKKGFRNRLSARHLIYFVVFLFTLHLTPSVYITSNFLSDLIDSSKVGYVYSISSLITILLFIFIRPFLIKYGNYKTFLITLFVELISLGILVVPGLHPIVSITALIFSITTQSTVYLHFDIFLANHSSVEDTGTVRSAFLTAQNIAFVIGPLLAGTILTDHDFWKIFLFGMVLMIPTILLSIKFFKNFKDPEYTKTDIVKTGFKVLKNKDLYNAISVNGLLRVFYAWMIIFTPIFLTQNIGFTVAETSSIIGIALIAFLIFTIPLGYVSDKILGEKEILITGFIIMAISTASMSFIEVKSFWTWAIVLFITRIGASMVEIMGESYFFKKIQENDVNMVSFHRMLRPMTYLVFPTLGSLLLLIIDIKHLFLILGVFMLYGVKYSLAIQDTR